MISPSVAVATAYAIQKKKREKKADKQKGGVWQSQERKELGQPNISFCFR